MKKNTVQASSRWFCIDLLEAIAILFVLIYHTTAYDYDFLVEPGKAIHYVRYFLRTILSTCVPLFFFANGFLLLNKKLDLRKHIFKTLRLAILSFVWGAIVLYLLSIIRNDSFTVKEFLLALWNWERGWIDYFWYMGTLICIYVLFPLIKTAFDNNKSVFYYFIGITAILTIGNAMINIIATIAAYFLLDYDGFLTVNWFNMFNPFWGIYGYAFVYFCIGGCAKQFIPYIDANRQKSNLIAIMVLAASMGLLFLTGVVLSRARGLVWDVVWYGYDTVFTLINVIAIFVLTTNYKGIHFQKSVMLISQNTLGIYFIHVVLIQFLGARFVENQLFMSWTGNMLCAVILLLLTLAVTIGIKKVPGLKMLL